MFCFTEWCLSQYPLGLSARIIPNSNIKGSTHSVFWAHVARLRNKKAWDVGVNVNETVHITIDLGELVLVSGVATQGFNEKGHSGRMTRYKVRHSYDGQLWYNYTYLNNSNKASCKYFYSLFPSGTIICHITLLT